MCPHADASIEIHNSAHIPLQWLIHCCNLHPVSCPCLEKPSLLHTPSITNIKAKTWYPSDTSHALPSPCGCCPTAAWDQQWRHCGTGGSGLTQLFCCPGLAWPLPETSPPSPAGTPHPPGVVAVTATANKHPTCSLCQKKKKKSNVRYASMCWGFHSVVFVVVTCVFFASTIFCLLSAHTLSRPFFNNDRKS